MDGCSGYRQLPERFLSRVHGVYIVYMAGCRLAFGGERHLHRQGKRAVLACLSRAFRRSGFPFATLRWLIALSAAGLLGLAQPPVGLWPLAGVALVPWLVALSRASAPGAAAGSFVVGTAYGCLTGAWVPTVLRLLGSSPVQGVLGLLASAAWAKGIAFALLGIVLRSVRSRNASLQVLVTGCAFFAVESWLSTWSLGIPWALVGHSQLRATGVAQLAVVGGVPLISGLLAAINQALRLAWEQRGARSEARLLAALVAAWAATAWLGLPLAGWARPLPPAASGPPLSLLIVQPNLPRGARWAADHQSLHLRVTASFTARALAESQPPPAAVVWPENLVTTPVDTSPALAAELREQVERLGVPVITGAVRSPRAGGPDSYRSSVLWLAPGAGIQASLDKVRAVPALEAEPSAWGEKLARRVFGRAAHWPKVEEADSAGPLRGAFTVTPVLCYEALFPALVAERRSPESVAILNLADDSWAKGDMATRQLLAFAAFRAIEQRLSLVRVAHGGLSAVIDEFGRRVLSLPVETFAHATVDLTPSAPPTQWERAALLGLPLTAGFGVWWALAGWTRRSPTRARATARDP